MIALDTNVVVRLLVNDDPAQVRRARKLLKQGPALVTASVLLETAWVLQSVYDCDRAQVARALRAFVGLEGVHTDATESIAKALDACDAGMDFADALHVAGAAKARMFATFDDRLVQRAKRAGLAGVVSVPP